MREESVAGLLPLIIWKYLFCSYLYTGCRGQVYLVFHIAACLPRDMEIYSVDSTLTDT